MSEHNTGGGGDLLELLTVAEAADRLRVSTATVYRLIRRRQLACVKVTGATTMLRPSQLAAFLESRTVAPD